MIFRNVVRVVFLFAYGAFLYASLRHIAYFFASFEPANTDWQGSYAIAISIDATSLILAIGVMFFRKGMSGWALAGIWLFILGLTAFSWLVNWEYAIQFQSPGLSKATDFSWLNPILASSFALLNVAYSIVAELFNAKQETVEELQKKLDEIKQTSHLKQELSAHKNTQVSTWISGKFQMLQDGFSGMKSGKNISQTSEQFTSELAPELAQDAPGISEEIEEEITPISSVKLGMIEQAMYDAFMKHPEETEALLALSQEQSLDEFVATLQQKYSQYAHYITAARVRNVMCFIEQQSVRNSDEIAQDFSPESDPEIQSVFDADRRKYLMTFEEASAYTGYSISALKAQVKRGEIKMATRGKLKVRTLKIKSGNTGQMPKLTVEPPTPALSNGYH